MDAHGLTPKQRRFVEEYLVDLNGTQAAIRAGYSADTANEQASQLLAKLNIQQAVASMQTERSVRTQVTTDYVLTNLVEITERCMQRAPVMVRQGKEYVQEVDDEGRHVWKFDARGANKSLELLGKHLAMFKEKVELTGKDGVPFAIEFVRADVVNDTNAGE